MSESETVDVPRPQEDPTPDAVHDAMEVGRCYVVADLVDKFSDEDANRWTIQNRLDALAAQGRVEKIKHVNDRVTYQRPHDPDAD